MEEVQPHAHFYGRGIFTRDLYFSVTGTSLSVRLSACVAVAVKLLNQSEPRNLEI